MIGTGKGASAAGAPARRECCPDRIRGRGDWSRRPGDANRAALKDGEAILSRYQVPGCTTSDDQRAAELAPHV